MEAFAPDMLPLIANLDSKTQRAYLLQSFKGEVRNNLIRQNSRDKDIGGVKDVGCSRLNETYMKLNV